MRLIARIFIGCVVVLGLNSCAVSGGDSPVSGEQPHAVVTTKKIVKAVFPYDVSSTAVYRIDGKQPSSMRLDDTFRVSPGKHSFNLSNIRYNRGAHADLEMIAEAGKRYVLKSDGVGDKVRFWAEDAVTGAVVASVLVKDEAREVPPMPIIITIPAG